MANFAIFTRNYRQHLAAVGKRGVFRSSVRWAKPKKALKNGDTIDVYIAPVDGNGEIEFRAKLERVLLDPSPNDLAVKEMMKRTATTTSGEGLWEGDVATLYELSGITKINPPFHFTELCKLSDGENISAEYSRSYCIVQAID